jgi:hypothetical protein
MKKLLTERALEYDADEILCSEEKYDKIWVSAKLRLNRGNRLLNSRMQLR